MRIPTSIFSNTPLVVDRAGSHINEAYDEEYEQLVKTMTNGVARIWGRGRHRGSGGRLQHITDIWMPNHAQFCVLR